jgi:cytochrome c biogenesis protein CcmG, thiol:disulfide interchange protein DsbE
MRTLFKLILLAAFAVATPATARKPVVGEVAPDFELTLINGTRVKLSELRGKVVVLNFWATWCAPCKKELPLLDAYYRVNQKHGLAVYALTTEDSVPIDQLKRLFAILAIPSARRIRGGYDVLNGVPTNYVFDRTGKLRYAEAGAFELDSLNELLVPLLREPTPPPLPATPAR